MAVSHNYILGERLTWHTKYSLQEAGSGFHPNFAENCHVIVRTLSGDTALEILGVYLTAKRDIAVAMNVRRSSDEAPVVKAPWSVGTQR